MLPPLPPQCQHSAVPAAAIPSRFISWCLDEKKVLPLDLVTIASQQKQQTEVPLFFRSQGGGCGTESIRTGVPNQGYVTVSDPHLSFTDSSNNNINSLPFTDKEVVLLPCKYHPRRILNGAVSTVQDFPPGCGPEHQPSGGTTIVINDDDVVREKRRVFPVSGKTNDENLSIVVNNVDDSRRGVGVVRKQRRVSPISNPRKINDDNISIIANECEFRVADGVSPRFAPELEEHERARVEVKDVCQLFDKTLASFRESFSLEKENKKKNAFVATANKLKRMRRWVNKEPRVGHIPGIEIGDSFRSRAEMVVIGLHRDFIKGIDTINYDGELLATCVVATDRYLDNDMGSKDHLWYSGQGGNPNVSQGVAVEDQKLKGGNYAIWNSMKKKTPIRVIRKKVFIGQVRYAYDGLYLVFDFTESKGVNGNLVFKFLLIKIKNQTPRGPLELIGNYKGNKEIAKVDDKKLEGCINRVTQMRNYYN